MNGKLSRRVLARAIAQKLVDEPNRRKHWLKLLAAYMVDHKMTDNVELLAKDIIREVFALNGELLVSATTARPLTDSLRKDLMHILRQATGAKQVVLDEHVDPAIIGGFVAQTPDAEFDASVRTTLQKLATIK